ncbi:MAG TPA: hypothetical protein VHF22_15250, partial [Planctomycetota bacterium]|nr:hypothetical protein [Planctomycetota bacterium]
MAPSVLATARFVAHFAVQDLFPFKRRRRSASFAARLADAAREAVSCTPTLLNMLVVAMLVFAGLVIGGIVMGALTLIHDQIEHNHFALCVE